MSEIVAADAIERVVGQSRHKRVHYGRAVTAEQTVYILHSRECRDSGIDLRDCEFSLALDRGIDLEQWRGFGDEAVALYLDGGRIRPLGVGTGDLTQPAEDVFGITHGGTVDDAIMRRLSLIPASFQVIHEAIATTRRLEGVIVQKTIEEK